MPTTAPRYRASISKPEQDIAISWTCSWEPPCNAVSTTLPANGGNPKRQRRKHLTLLNLHAK